MPIITNSTCTKVKCDSIMTSFTLSNACLIEKSTKCKFKLHDDMVPIYRALHKTYK
jgi:hypothetical protein